jgi:hypothetical protein
LQVLLPPISTNTDHRNNLTRIHNQNLKCDTFDLSDSESIAQIISCAPTTAAARSLCENHNLRVSPGLGSAASAAAKLYERLPFLTAAAAHVDAEALNLWQLTGLMSR